MNDLDNVITGVLRYRREEIEKQFNCSVLAYYADIRPDYLNWFRSTLEATHAANTEQKKLAIVLNTPGGSVETVEQMVVMVRHFYSEVVFIVPNMAMSAGTIFCMSGDAIYMDYSSALGPIDPQVQSKEGHWVPALGYLDKYEEILQKAANNTLTGVEFAIAQSQDMALLRRYEQARDLSVSLLEEWLVKYKFKNWSTHASSGEPVTPEQRNLRAHEIAAQLGDNKIWHSHGRRLGIDVLRNRLRLEIVDYSEKDDVRSAINAYHDLIADCMAQKNWSIFMDNTGK
ncbi:ATP-dependent Clp protease proteolytic subunit [Deefgea tanakiae]|uniref:ATP-dependent Clp protease proteolytic subunit n=1 Tax=Deefgea tanakiae TaxID=2865840 RepID=A0ABX8Z4J0_9NEIS|nr:ATP-dependent Clp protease proteolytic subunit [Deefgea tanakiae]QZA77486.1 ATP-dependent Clp protease proteolytic subunit [Deefgea tanakiae]